MTIKESLDKLDEILKNTESSVIEDNFKDIAEALEIDSDGVDTVEGMVEAIKTSVSSIEESDVEAVVEELSKFFEDDDFKGDGAEIDGKKQNEIKKSKKATDKDAVDKLKEEAEDKKVQKFNSKYAYVMANDMFNKLGTNEFFNINQINNFHAHEFEKGLGGLLLSKATTLKKSASNFI